MDDAPTLSVLLRVAEHLLAMVRIRTARLDAEVLLASVVGTNRAGLYARLRDPATAAVAAQFNQLVTRRMQREPLPYITGHKEFYSLDFAVDPSVLIPRPETEHLVEAAVAHLAGRPQPWICDVGTGSGCVAVALAHALPAATIVASDISRPALRIARQNAERHDVQDRIHFVVGDYLSPFDRCAAFDVIVSNPPYLRRRDWRSPELSWEPRGALVSGEDGLEAIIQLIAIAPDLLRADGMVAVEIGAHQAADAVAFARAAGLESVSVKPDLAGLPRVLVAYRAAGARLSDRLDVTTHA